LTKVFRYDTVGSTNAIAAEKLRAGEPPPFWVTAEEQTQGRGRDNRTWISKPGNLYASYAFAPACELKHLPHIAFVAALAVRDAIQRAAPAATVDLKWPNDCLVDGAKISGILIETPHLNPPHTIIGCGINIAHAPEGLPYATTAIAQHATADVTTVFETLQHTMQHWLDIWKHGSNFESIRQAWLASASNLNNEITIRTSSQTKSGTFKGIDETGALLLEREGHITRHYAGDVSIS
jgi:BirA family transcriptional regulator, biotin operon repressor / biotin---[acetyl-CoA-carboxylase] ligase